MSVAGARNKNALISAVVPVHNGAAFLQDAINSIRAQRYDPLEIIIIDDGSVDETAKIIAGLGDDIHAMSQHQQGPAAARNYGLALAHGEYIAFLDADDLWRPDKLALQVGYLAANPTVEVVLGHILPFRDSDTLPTVNGAYHESAPGVQLGCAVFRKSVFDKVGSFNKSLFFGEDHDWFLRARERGVNMVVLDQVTLLYRRHSASMTAAREYNGAELPGILKASLDRRRAMGTDPHNMRRLIDYQEAKL